MKPLVFGVYGQVATELRRQADVTAVGRQRADLTDPASCARVIRETAPDVIINAAAFTAVDKAESEPNLAYLVNAMSPAVMAETAHTLGARFLHISTDYVFDGQGERAWKTDDPTAPINAYGRSKSSGEQAILAACPDALILRTSWVFSAHGSNFVKTMLRLGRERDALSIVGDQVGGPTPAADIAATLLQLAAVRSASGIYHYSGAPDVSWAEFAREIFRQEGLDVDVTAIPTSDYPTPAARPSNSRLDCSDLARDHGIERPDWREGLGKVLGELASDRAAGNNRTS